LQDTRNLNEEKTSAQKVIIYIQLCCVVV